MRTREARSWSSWASASACNRSFSSASRTAAPSSRSRSGSAAVWATAAIWRPSRTRVVTAALLRLDPGEQVWARARELLIDGRIAELSVSYFPATVAESTGLMAPGDFPPGGVVGVLEDAGHRVLRTYNEARARLATDEELRAFGADPRLQPLHGQIVLEIIHGTYGAEDEALEALVSVRPAAGNVIVFETYEGEDGEADQPAGISHTSTAGDV